MDFYLGQAAAKNEDSEVGLQILQIRIPAQRTSAGAGIVGLHLPRLPQAAADALVLRKHLSSTSFDDALGNYGQERVCNAPQLSDLHSIISRDAPQLSVARMPPTSCKAMQLSGTVRHLHQMQQSKVNQWPSQCSPVL